MEKFAAAGALLLGLAACGGGGGGGGGSGGSAPAALTAPAAPALGATLQADAAALRPLRDGSQWVYEGVEINAGGPSQYLATVSVAASGGSVVETLRNVLNAGDDSVTLTIANGQVTARQSVDITGNGRPGVLEAPELRSPVRVNDQWTLVERSGEALAADFDGDRVNDSGDYVLYARVIGSENVTLPKLGRTLQAVRVDLTLLLRVRKSSDGQFLPTFNTVQSAWYAPGIGVVRRTSTALSTSGVGAVDTDEQLTAYDGIGDGLGSPGLRVASYPAAQAPQPGAALQPALAAVGLGSSALVLTQRYGQNSLASGFTLAALDRSGNVTAVRDHPQFAIATNVQPRLLRAGSQALVVWSEFVTFPDPPYQRANLRVLRVDAAGAVVGDPAGVALPLQATSQLALATQGTSLWALWVRNEPGDSFFSNGHLVVQPFDLGGVPLAAAQELESVPTGQPFQGLGLVAAADGALLASWVSQPFPLEPQLRYARIPATGAAVVRTLGTSGTRSATPVVDYTPRAFGSVLSLGWRNTAFETLTFQAAPRLRAVALDAALNPVRASSASLDTELLAGTTDATAESWTVADATAGPVLVAAAGTGTVPGLAGSRTYVELAWFTPGAAALSQGTTQTLRLATDGLFASDRFRAPSHVVPLDGPVLVLGGEQRLVVASMWPR